jgi:beta-glucosidase
MKKNLLKKSLLVLTGCIVISFIPVNKSNESTISDLKDPIYRNTSYSFEERAADLVSRLTLEEKQSLLGNSMTAVPRLGVNAFNVWSEALHGVLAMFNPNAGAATSFPNSVALGSAWDPKLMQRETSIISEEARGFNSSVISGLTFWSPVVEPIRDPRWGRTGESFGEDPFLISQIAGGFIRGMMGDDPTYLKTVPCGKHFFANNSEFDRHVSSSEMDQRDMREFYLAPYKKLIEKDNLPSIMSCYNAVNGVPVTASKYLIDTIARRTYGLKGYVTGDCAAVEDIYTGHYFVKTATQATALGLKAGVDSDCGSVYQTSAIDALKEGLITEAEIDQALVNMFTMRMRIGEFDPKGKVPYALIQPNVVNAPGNIALAAEIATKTPVLLKNNLVIKTNRKALPLRASELKKIALIGPQADKVELGPYSGRPAESNMITPLAGIKKYLSQKGLSPEVVYSSGANTASKSNLFFVLGFELVKTDKTVAKYDATAYSSSAKGITVGSGMSAVNSVRSINDGDWTSYSNINISNTDSIKINLVVPTDGGSIEVRIGSVSGNLLASLNASPIQGMGGAYGRARTIKAKINKLGVEGNQDLYLVYRGPAASPIDKETLAMAASSDVAIVFVGTDDKTAGEEADRLTLLIPGNQVELIKAVAAVNPNTIVVMQTLGCVEVEEFKNLPNVTGIVWTGFNGQAQGTAMASVLFGDVNPGGKLNATWYKSVNDLPEITDYNLRGSAVKNGRTYWYFNKDVSYEFGFGLSYTTFEYSNFEISKSVISPNDKITVSVDVKNTGPVDGDEIVQVYLKTPDSPASLQRPIKRLKGFQRVTIPAGQTKTIAIDIDCIDLWFWDGNNNKLTFDQGKYVFEIGASSKDIKGKVEAVMSGTLNSVIKTVVAECGNIVMKNGSTAQTRVTAAMSDDSFYDITKAKLTYKSNNPGVATVDEKGLVTAKGVGVASITAYVTIGDKTLSDSFPLKIMPNLQPSSISVNDRKIPGFNPEIHGYSYLLNSKPSSSPMVSVIPADASINVETVQAKSVPGTALITLTDNVTVDKKEYAVNFGLKSVSDEFNSNTLGNQWGWIRENKSNWSLTKSAGALVIKGEKGDITGTTNNAANILLQSANTDWTIVSKIVYSRKPSGFNQQGGLIVYQDDDNYVKLVYRSNFRVRSSAGGSGILDMIIEKNGYQFSIVNVRSADVITDNKNTLVLKLEKKGINYNASYSTDGKNFISIGKIDVILSDIKAGIIVCNGSTEGRPPIPGMQQQNSPEEVDFEVSYDYFHIINSGLK